MSKKIILRTLCHYQIQVISKCRHYILYDLEKWFLSRGEIMPSMPIKVFVKEYYHS